MEKKWPAVYSMNAGKWKGKELDVSLKVVDHTVASGYLKLLIKEN